MTRIPQVFVLSMFAALSGCSEPVGDVPVDVPVEALGDKTLMDTYLGKTVRVTGKPVLDKAGDCIDAGDEYFVIRDCNDFPLGSDRATVTGKLSRYEVPGWSAYMLVNARVER